ncbi:MAG: thiol protease/hemagglutinin PrtT [Bacteroidales bacterium]|nr:thiol protease/hemagglutinin PrtT [Bacteroidales bacterium]
MKRIATIIALACISCTSLMAARVDSQRAHDVALRFWNSLPANSATPATVMADRSEFLSLNNLYLFTPEQGDGFVVIAADDRVVPVMAYSTNTPATSELPYGTGMWLAGLDKHIAHLCKLISQPSAEVTAAWDIVSQPKGIALKSTIAHPVEPLLHTTWNQSPYYNFFCPFDTLANNRSVSGCTVTAMTQIMKYWNHPYNGTGSHGYYLPHLNTYLEADFSEATYNWDVMPESLSSRSRWNAINAVALITYHAGIAVEMHYSANASGAYCHAYGNDTTVCAENALWKYFKYNHSTMHSYRRDSIPNYHLDERMILINDDNWQALIDNELLAGRPVLYTGYDSTYSGGHAFVCDGADGTGKYHFNWGWGSAYDGYYMLSNLTPGSNDSLIGANTSGSYNIGQGITIGIQPIPEHIDTISIVDTVCPSVPYVIDSLTFTSETHDTIRYRTTLTFIHLTEDIVRSCGLRNSEGTESMNTLYSCPSIGFVLPECEFTHPTLQFIGWNAAIDGSGPMYQPGDTISARGNRNVYAQWGIRSGIANAEGPTLAATLSPNPATESTTLHCSGVNSSQCQVKVYDILGHCIRTLNPTATSGSIECNISLSDLPRGTYTVQITTLDGHAIGRIIKQ